MPSSAVTTHTVEQTVGIALRGDITDAETAHLRTVLVAAIRRGAGEVVVDLTDVTGLDSTAIGALLAASEIAVDKHMPFQIVCPTPAIATELSAVGLGAALRPVPREQR